MEITKNILVNIQYRLTDEQNNHLNPADDELIYLHGGYGHIFEDLEKALEGKKVGDNFKVTLSPHRAFGHYREDLAVQEPIDELPDDIFIGMELDGTDEISNETIIYTVTDIEDDFAILNANHPFAGRTVTFEGVIVELQSLSDEEAAALLAYEEEHHCHHNN